MDVISQFDEAFEFIEENLPNDDRYISTFAHQQIVDMEWALKTEHEFALPDTDDLLRELVFVGDPAWDAVGVIQYSHKRSHLYVLIVSMLLEDTNRSITLLGYMRLFLAAFDLEPQFAIERRVDGWYLVSSATFDAQHGFMVSAKVPEASA